VRPTVPEETAVGDVDAALDDGEGAALLFHPPRQAGRIDRTVPAHGAFAQVEGEQLVMGPGGEEGDDVQRVRRRVGDGGARDPGRVDVAARQAGPVDGRA